MQELAAARDRVETWGGLHRRASDAAELIELAEAEGDSDVLASAGADLDTIEKEFEALEFQLQLSGQYDSRNAILAVHAGAGGTDSQDWAEMLLRMYLRWAERKGYSTDILDLTEGEEAGIKSTTVEIKGKYAFGYLQSERGVHRLVRLSPFNSASARQTSFAKVEVMPEVEQVGEIQVPDDDIRVDVYRSSGAGGQNVQKNSTAVRITHIPTGIVVTCQNERSQLQNKARAMVVLAARLQALAEEQASADASADRASQIRTVDRSERIRTYNFPENRTADHRINFKAHNLDQVLDGDMDALLDALGTADKQARLQQQS